MEASVPHLFMNARIVASSVLATLSLGFAQAAMAEEVWTEETPETIESLSHELTSLTCEGKEGREIGRCITDVLKRIRTIEYNFSLWYKRQVKEWRAEHDGDGISEEYTLALKAFNDQMQEKRKYFQEQVRNVRKAFFDEQTIVRVQKGEVNTKGSTSLTTAEEKELLKQCNEKFASDQDAERVCLRNIIQRHAAVEKRLAPVRARIKENEENAVTRPLRPKKPLR